MCETSAKNDRSSTLLTRFAFDGEVSSLLREYFELDAQSAHLSTSFTLYYRLRPFIPVSLRRRLQRERNRGMDVPNDWYIPNSFADDFRAAVAQEPDRLVIHPWPDNFETAIVLTHDVETSVGMERIDKLAKLEEAVGLRSAWNIVPYKYKVDDAIVADLKQRGHEVGVHGYNHDGRLFESPRTFRRRTGPMNQAIKRFGSTGFRAPMVHRNLQWLQDLDIDYDASCFDVDPFQAMSGGVGGVWPFFAGKFVELPYTLPQDHTLLVTLGQTSPQIWIEKLAFLRRLAGMALLITHPDYLDTPQRMDVYRAALEHFQEQQDAWHALPGQVAQWWRQRDSLEILEAKSSPRLVGPSANRARILALGDLLGGELRVAGKHRSGPTSAANAGLDPVGPVTSPASDPKAD